MLAPGLKCQALSQRRNAVVTPFGASWPANALRSESAVADPRAEALGSTVDLLAERVLRRVDAQWTLRRRPWRDDGCPLTVQVSQPARPREDEMRFRHSRRVGRSRDVVEDERYRSVAHGTGASGIPLEVLGAVGMGDEMELFGEVACDITRHHSRREGDGDERVATGHAETRRH